jgi:predicted dehydrogenase
LIADFLDAVEKGRDPAVPGEALLRVHRLIDRLLYNLDEVS